MSPSNPPSPARARATVDLTALRQNAATLARLTGVPLLPMVKANAYGLGAVAVARALEPLDPWGFGVATLPEASELRAAGITRPIISFCPLVPGDAGEAQALRVRPVIGDWSALAAWTALGDAPFHLEIDTGMRRSGFDLSATGTVAALARALDAAPGLEGVFTHFHSAERDPVATAAQWSALLGAVEGLPRRPALVHAANSAGALAGRAYAGSMVRPGIFLYGGHAGEIAPAPVVRFTAPVIALRSVDAGQAVSYDATWQAPAPVRVATLGVGYADGLPRALQQGGVARIRGRDCRIVGRITMDMTLVAVEDGVVVGDEAELYGPSVSLDHQAACAGTIAYELLTALGRRVTREYLGD